MSDQFTPIENDHASLVEVGVAESSLIPLAVAKIFTVKDLVTEFRKPSPFDDVDGIGDVKETYLLQRLLEYRARCCDPLLFVRLLLSRSSTINYVVVLVVVGASHLATYWMGFSTFDRDDIGTILAGIAAALAFDLGQGSRSPAILNAPFSTNRRRILAVLLVVASTRVAVSQDFGSTEASRFIFIGCAFGVVDAFRTWARCRAVENDPTYQKIAQLSSGSASPDFWTRLKTKIRELPKEARAAIVAGVFSVVTALITLLQAVIVAFVNPRH